MNIHHENKRALLGVPPMLHGPVQLSSMPRLAITEGIAPPCGSMSATERGAQHLDCACAKKENARLRQRGYATGIISVTKWGKLSVDCLKDG